MENRQWSEQECKDAAVMIGVSEVEAVAYYEHFGAVGFMDGCNRPIKNLRLHMMKCKRAGWWPGESSKPDSISDTYAKLQDEGKIPR